MSNTEICAHQHNAVWHNASSASGQRIVLDQPATNPKWRRFTIQVTEVSNGYMVELGYRDSMYPSAARVATSSETLADEIIAVIAQARLEEA